MDFLPLAKDRYSVRKLKDQPVEQEKIEKILEAAMVAPTAANYQPFRVWVMKNPEALEKVRSAVPMPFVQESPVVFVVGGDPETAWTRSFDGHNFADVDASIAATHMMLEVHELGLGTTWVGYFDVDKMVSIFPEMKGYSLVAVFGVGYPAEDSEPNKLHSTFKDKDQLFTIL